MADVIKKGLLEVKRKGRFGGYKQKYVLLCNSLTLKCKTVEICDTEGSKSSVDVIRLNDVWSVQDRPSRSRYVFELFIGEDAILTFSCSTVVEREEWTEAFRVLNQLALPSSDSPLSFPVTEYLSVTLMKNRSALEIGHSGQYLISITSSAIVLHWRTGAIAHHWPKKNITKLYHPGREGRILLIVKRTSGAGSPMDFEFITDKESAMQILKLWNIRLLESIPCNPQQLNDISSSLTAVSGESKSKRTSRKSKSFRDSNIHKIESQENTDSIKRVGSFSRMSSYGTNVTLGGVGLSQGSVVRHPLPITYGNRGNSWTENLDQPDASSSPIRRFGSGRMSTSPPPLPSRPVESSDDDDPDYAYIDESEVIGPKGQRQNRPFKRDSTTELDNQLEELRKSIAMENKSKRKEAEKRKTYTLQPRPKPSDSLNRAVYSLTPSSNTMHMSPSFSHAEPEDYLEPVSSKGEQFLHTRSISEPYFKATLSPNDHSSQNAHDLSPCSSDMSPVSVGNPPALPPRTWRADSGGEVGQSPDMSVLPVQKISNGGQERIYRGSETIGGAKFIIVPSEDQHQKVLDEPKYSKIQFEPTTSQVTPAPPLPPRSPTRDHTRLSRNSSSSSSVSSSSSQRCPRCHNLKKSKSTVSKTISLDPKPPRLNKGESRKSLPNLEATIVEDMARQRSSHRYRDNHHSCSRCSRESSTDQLGSESNTSMPSSHNLEYLQLVDEDSQPAAPSAGVDTELSSELDLLTSCLETLEYLTKRSENKPSSSMPELPSPMNSQRKKNPYDHIKLKSTDSVTPLMSLQTDLKAAEKETEQVQRDLAKAHTKYSKSRSLTTNHESQSTRSKLHPAVSAGQQYPHGRPHSGLWHTASSLPPSGPPVPPRSSVSLTQPGQADSSSPSQPRSSSVYSGKSQSLGRAASLQTISKLRDPLTARGNSALDSTPVYHGNLRSKVNQFEASPSSNTVFIHHLKDHRLAHMV